jgi:CO/xanthine dehydrogenase FAD-binding subunit
VNLPEFELHEPATVGEACRLLEADPEGSAIFAGGTDILVNLKEGLVSYRHLISLRRIAGLSRIEFSAERGLCIGAAATVNQVARHEAVAANYPGILDAALSLAADQVRCLATVGGNLCSAVPSADMAPILLAWDASARLASRAGERSVPLRGFFTAPRKTVVAKGEMLVAIEVPPPLPGAGDASLRQGGRDSLSLPIAIVASCVAMDGELCRAACVALGAVSPTPRVATVASDFLAGRKFDAETLAEVGGLARQEAVPIDDLRSSKAYRLELVEVLTRRTLASAARRAGRG